VVVVVALRQGWEEVAVAGTLGLWAGKEEHHILAAYGDLGRVVEGDLQAVRDTVAVRMVMVVSWEGLVVAEGQGEEEVGVEVV
jgi:hypothetical protein